MARVHTVKAAAKDYPNQGIAKGDTYYWWKFRFGGKQTSKTYPRRSQLTQSAYLGTIYDLQDQVNKETPAFDDLESQIDNYRSELETLRDEQQEKLDNMPDGLREGSSSGEMLQERYDNLDNAINELESIDLEYDENDEAEEGESEDAKAERITEEKNTKADEIWEQVREAVGNL